MSGRKTRGRSPKAAKAAGSRFEREVADYLAKRLGDERIDRKPKTGAKDKGDIANVYIDKKKLCIECKNTARMQLPEWVRQAQTEALNDKAPHWAVIHKRHGVGDISQQWVTLTLEEYVNQHFGKKGKK